MKRTKTFQKLSADASKVESKVSKCRIDDNEQAKGKQLKC